MEAKRSHIFYQYCMHMLQLISEVSSGREWLYIHYRMMEYQIVLKISYFDLLYNPNDWFQILDIQSHTEPELLIKKNNNQNFVLIIYRYQNKPNAFFFFLFLVRFDARWFTNFSDFSLIGARAGVGVGGSVIPPVRQSKFLSEPDYHLHVRKVPPRGQTYGTKMIIIIIMDHYLHTKIAMHFIKFWLFANCQTSFQIVLFAFDVYFWTP